MVYVFLANGFEEVEALTPIDCLRRCGIDVVTVGIGGQYITGSHNITVKTDITEDNVKLTKDIQMIICPGGMPGTLNLEKSETVQKAIDYCVDNNIYIACICAGPIIVGHKGLLNGKNACCFEGFEKDLLGANILYDNVVVSDNFITSRGMGVALDFGVKLVEVLKSKDDANKLLDKVMYKKNMSVTQEKNILRTKYKEIRKSLKDEFITQNIDKKSFLDKKLFENLIHNVDFNKYRAVLCYVSFGIEVDTHMLIEYLQEKNISLYAPKCYKHDSSMRFFSINDTDNLISGEYKGILEPIEDKSNELLDFSNCLCIVPALTFDNQGYRLGWGGGYYDRFFSVNPDIFKVGLTYNCCMTETVPKDIYDISVNMVVTEENILLFGGTNEH